MVKEPNRSEILINGMFGDHWETEDDMMTGMAYDIAEIILSEFEENYLEGGPSEEQFRRLDLQEKKIEEFAEMSLEQLTDTYVWFKQGQAQFLNARKIVKEFDEECQKMAYHLADEQVTADSALAYGLANCNQDEVMYDEINLTNIPAIEHLTAKLLKENSPEQLLKKYNESRNQGQSI